MTVCKRCGQKGHGLVGTLLQRYCVVCQTNGCDKCVNLHYIISSFKVENGLTGTLYGYTQTGCCSLECYQRYWTSEVVNVPSRILELPYLKIYTSEVFAAHLVGIISTSKQPSSEAIEILKKYSDRPLAQGIIMMHMGFKTLDHSKITDGLRLCRSDILYEQIARQWVDALATSYVQDLKRLDVATSRADLGSVVVSVAPQKGQNDPRLTQCPACGARVEQMVVRGQTVRCVYCGSVFQVG